MPIDIRPGDLVLYAVRIREKGSQVFYYGCEVVDRVVDGVPVDAGGRPFNSVKAIYRRNGTQPAPAQQGRVLLARAKDDPGEKLRLQGELGRRFGPGELVMGFQCPGKAACTLR